MNDELSLASSRRVQKHAALADPARLQMVDLLLIGDRAPSELQDELGLSSNLIAHHINVLQRAGLVARSRSEADRRRTYLHLVPGALAELGPSPALATRPSRLVFVCTANSARSQLAAELWSTASALPAASAGTHPASTVDPGALAVAARRGLPMHGTSPRHLDEVAHDGDLIITVCDAAHEELGGRAQLHWSVPDPVRSGTDAAFDEAFDDIVRRIGDLAPRLHPGAMEA